MASSGTSGSTTLLIVGTFSALLGLLALGIGGGLLVFSTLRGDRDGLLSIDDVNLATDTYALVSENLELTAWPGPADWTPRLGDVSLRLEVTEGADEALFVGVAPTAAVADYLDGVAHEVLTSINHSGASSRTQPGTATPAPPGQAQFWSESVSGPGTQTLTWDVAPGNWTTVVMAADGSAGVDVSASAALRFPVVTPLGFGLLAVAAVVLVIAVILLVAGAATRPPTTESSTAPAPSGPHPAALTAALDPGLSRWQWLVKWLLAIPHVVVLAFLWIAFVLATVGAGLSILFTRRYPRAIFDFNVGVLRWTWRVSYYAYSVLGTDTYPPFTLARTDYPADFDVVYPEGGLSRGLVLVKWWLLAIPHYLVVAVLTGGVVSWSSDVGAPRGWEVAFGGGLVGILSLVAVIVLAAGGRHPRGLYDPLLGLQRWVFRVTAYAALMTDVYPPFPLDPGGSERVAGQLDGDDQPSASMTSEHGPDQPVPVP